jgi:hypothetical protein
MSYFADPETFDALDLNDICDAHGAPLIGEDEHGFWWGTSRAAWVLHEEDCVESVFVVYGWLGPEQWTGYFMGHKEDAVSYAECHSVIVEDVEQLGGPETWR